MPEIASQLSTALKTQTRQGLELTHEQRLGLEVLQKNAMELQNEISTRLQTNPMLVEVQSPCVVYENELPVPAGDGPQAREEREMDGDGGEFRDRLIQNSVEGAPDPAEAVKSEGADGVQDDRYAWEMTSAPWDADADERRQHFFDSYSRDPGFLALLLQECVGTIQGDEKFRELCRKLCLAVDEAGYLQGTDEELCEQTGATPEELHRGIRAIQSLEPPGIGARSLKECLLLQLARENHEDSIDWQIVSNHLDDLSKNRLPAIARELGCSLEDVQDAARRIRLLNPTPGNELHCETVPTILPDVYVERDKLGQWSIRMNRDAFSILALDEGYLKMLSQEDLDRQTRDYLKKNLGEATTFIHAIDERQRTIERIALVLLALQGKFFETGRPEDLRPLNLDRVADRLGLAGSTISRAIAGKFMWTPWGIRSFKSFFSSGYRSQSGEEVSSLKVRMRIKEIIGGEDSKHPVSDQEISDRLKKEGFTVKRRTVAKYRELDGIPTSSQRRVHG